MSSTSLSVAVEIEEGDITALPSDVLVLKYAQELFGADQEVVSRLETEGLRIAGDLPPEEEFLLVEAVGSIEAEKVLFLGVEQLYQFRYPQIRDFARRALETLAEGAPDTRTVLMTVHGVQYGLDEFEAFEAQLAGLVDAISDYRFPLQLERICIGERDTSRVERLRKILNEVLPRGRIDVKRKVFTNSLGEARTERLRSAGYGTERKAHIFVAMPFSAEMQDIYDYGIMNAARSAGFVCERADLSAFTGDVLAWIQKRIKSATLVVAEVSDSNPNVYLEVGYAWGCGVPTVLIANDAQNLPFDVRLQRCITYTRIKELEESLAEELQGLRSNLGI